MALPAYSIVINASGVATAYTTKAAAETAFNALTLTAGQKAYLILNAEPTKERAKESWEGTYVDSYGTVRVIGTNEVYEEPEEPEGE